jgi:hypothetical protein
MESILLQIHHHGIITEGLKSICHYISTDLSFQHDLDRKAHSFGKYGIYYTSFGLTCLVNEHLTNYYCTSIYIELVDIK